MYKIGDVCCLPAPAPAQQPFSSNSLDLSAPEEAYIRNVRASDTLKLGNEGVFITTRNASFSQDSQSFTFMASSKIA